MNKILARLRSNNDRDGRKYRMSVLFAAILFTAFLVVCTNPIAFGSLYTQLITALITILTIFCGGNIYNKHVLGKHGKLYPEKKSEDVASDPNNK